MTNNASVVRTTQGWGLLIDGGRVVVDLTFPDDQHPYAQALAREFAKALNFYAESHIIHEPVPA